MGGIPLRVRRQIWFRQFLLQGCWNYEGMQNVGFAYSILPALRDRYEGRPEELSRAIKRHMEFFNTHPAMAAVILGATVRLEERVAAGETDPRAVGTFKVGLMGSLGAIGDSYFWGALKPMASAAGAILAFVHPLLGVAALLFLYNLSHLALRSQGFAAGMEGEDILGGAYAGVVGSHTAYLFGGGWLELGVFLMAALAVHLFTIFFRKAVSPSEMLLFLLIIGMLILWR